MTLFFLTVVIFGFSVSAMAVGAFWGRPPLGNGCASAGACDGCRQECARNRSEAES